MRRSAISTLAVTTAGVAWVAAALADGGALDTTFSSDGKADSLTTAPMIAVARQGDGKLLAGGTYTAGGGGSFRYHYVVARFTAAGELDAGFGGGDGIVDVDFGSYDAAGGVRALGVDSAGRILVGGQRNYDMAVLRLTADGAVDSGFGAGGVREVPGTDRVQGLAVTAGDGVAVAGESHVALLTSGGAVDGSFSGDGVAAPSGMDDAGPVVVDGGKIAVAADFMGGGTFASIFRFEPDGDLDPTFDGDGRAGSGASPGGYDPGGLAVDGQGRYLVGYSVDGGLGVSRLSATGELDTAFGVTRKTPKQEGVGAVYSVAPEPSGAMILAGNHGLFRINAGGMRDTTFVPPLGAGGRALVQPDGRIVVTAGTGLWRLNPSGPGAQATAEPTASPTAEPTAQPTVAPTAAPTAAPAPAPGPGAPAGFTDGDPRIGICGCQLKGFKPALYVENRNGFAVRLAATVTARGLKLRATAGVAANDTGTLAFRVARKQRRAYRPGRKLKLVVVATDPLGASRTITRTVKVARKPPRSAGRR